MNALHMYSVLNKSINASENSSFDGKYSSLTGQPQINGITLTGNKTLEDLGIVKAITDAIGNVTQISFEVVESFSALPPVGEVGTFYLVPNNTGENNNYSEYIWDINNAQYELIGTIQSDIDLSNYYTKVQVDELVSKMPSSQSDCTPVGTIISYMGVNAPTGYLKCDGSIYNISQYQELANHFKSNFGSVSYFGGNGTTTFAVPDLRGEFLRGTGTASRNTGSGTNVGLHQDPTEIVNMEIDGNRNLQMPYNNVSYSNAEKSYNQTGRMWTYPSDRTNGISVDTVYKITTRPTNTSVLYCIKYKKVVEIA